jgi:hypothetical protein
MRRRFVTSASGVTEVGDVTETQAGQPEDRLHADSLRLEVAPETFADGGFGLLVYINEVEMTSIGAGMGMDPYDVIIPTNLLVASPDPHTVRIARSEWFEACTDITITLRGDLVHWDWLFAAPINRDVSFNAGRL